MMTCAGVRRWTLFVLTLVSIRAQAATWSDDFSSTQNWDTSQSSAVVNLALKRIHPTLRVTPWGAGSATKEFDVGNGEHGAFGPSTYTQFGTYQNGVITVNTQDFPVLQVTGFTLSAGDTLRGSGELPLIIRSQSDIVVSGVIDCSGGDGTNLTGTDLVTSASGGVARCGSGNGGAGGTASQPNGSTGSSGGSTLVGGAGGGTGAAGAGGNGGSGYTLNLGGFIATQGQNNATAVPTNNDDTGFAIAGGTLGGGGSGGGGGGLGTTSNGAGGGAGGGLIMMTAVRDITLVAVPSATGSVLANGGRGGVITSGVAGSVGGGGGSGGGGSILMFAGRKIDFGGLSGPPYLVSTTRGTSVASQGFDGGNGSLGRTWIVDGDDAAAPGYPDGSLDDPQSNLGAQIGRVEFATSEQIVYSRIIDLRSTKPYLISASLNSTLNGAATATLELRGSSDGFISDATPWTTASSIRNVSGYRYIQLRIRLDNDHPTNYSYVSGVSIEYEPLNQKQFEMVAGCGKIGAGPLGWIPWAILLALVFALRQLLSLRHTTER